MLSYLREVLCTRFGELDAISQATGIEIEDLRRFAFGKTIPDGFDLDQLAIHFNLKLVPHPTQDLLPLETAASTGIQIDYAEHFQHASGMILFALEVIGSKPGGTGRLPEIKKPRGLSWDNVQLAVGVYAKIIKQARSIIALCELGLVKDAGAIERCMFEAVLALQFLLRLRVGIKEDGKDVFSVRPPPPRICSKCGYTETGKVHHRLKRLGTQMRTTLYAAFAAISRQRELNGYIEQKLDVLAKELGDPAEINKAADLAKKKIGKGWTKRQTEKTSYAGVSIRDLAASYELYHYYISVYRRQSATVHAADGIDFVRPSATDPFSLDLGPNPDKIGVILYLSTSLLLGSIDTLNKRLGLGFDAKVKAAMNEQKKRGGIA